MSDGPSNTPLEGIATNEPPTETTSRPQQNDVAARDTTPTASGGEQKSQDPVQKKRDEFLYDLLRTLDLLVYVELAIIYYLDTSTLLLLLRTFLHLSQLTIPDLTSSTLAPALMRKPPPFDPNTPVLLTASILCFFYHLFTAPPSASELTRFYLHGSVIVDFIGQYANGGWSAKMRLCCLDVLVGVIQQVVCAVAVERARAGGGRGRASGDVLVVGLASSGAEAAGSIGAQVIGGETSTSSTALAVTHGVAEEANGDDIELETLTTSGRRPATVAPTPRSPSSQSSRASSPHSPDAPLLASTSTDMPARVPYASDQESDPNNPASITTNRALEHLYSGQSIITTLHLGNSLRNAFWEQRNRRLRRRV